MESNQSGKRKARRCVGGTVGALLLFALLAGCDRDDDIPRIAGAWEGAEAEWTVRIVLQDTGQRFSGSGVLESDTAAYAVVVSNGIHIHPDISLSLEPSDREAINLQGRFVDDHTIEGRLSGWRFLARPITLRRVQ